ncbi:MAG: FGGY-family carbohydrate kinase [Alphaproteobacteria bacterium]
MLFLGIDIGGTMIKAGLYTREGEEVAVSEQNGDVITLHSGWVERDMEEFWQSVCFCIHQSIQRANIDAKQIRGVGFSAHGKGLYCIDEYGKPVRHGIISSDTRAAPLVKDWIRKGVDKKAYPLGRQQLWTAHPVSLLAWLKQNEPENYRKIDTVFMAHDYIRYKLSGEKNAEITNISASNGYNLKEGCYDEDMLTLFGIADSLKFFPPVISSFEQAGSVSQEAAAITGLLEGTPIFGGVFDVVGGALAAGVADEQTLNIIAGTWAITTRMKNNIEESDYPYIWGNYSIENSYFVHEGSPTSASNLQWFVDTFMENHEDALELCNAWVEELYNEPAEVFFMPYLYGSNISLDLHAGFYGLQAYHEKKHMVKAIYEGIVYSYLIHHQRIMALEPKITKIRFTGGPTRSKIWMQLFCDAIGMEMEVVELKQPGCSSAAFCAIVGTYKDVPIKTLMEQFQPSVMTYQPNMEQYERLMQQFEKYKTIATKSAEISELIT